MRNAMFVASATFALCLPPTVSSAQEPHWVFEVPFDLKTLNQDVDHVRVGCRVRVAPNATILGEGQGEEIRPDAQGNVSGVATVPVSADIGNDPGTGHAYSCYLRVFSADGSSASSVLACDAALGGGLILSKPKPGTPCTGFVQGSIFP